MSGEKIMTEDQFRRAFILILVVLILIGFITMIRHFVLAVIVAAIFSALVYPFYQRLTRWYHGRERLASVTVIFLTILLVGIPAAGLVSLVAAETMKLSSQVMPWVKEQVEQPGTAIVTLPDWVPFSEKIDPRKQIVTEKLGEWSGSLANFVMGSISTATREVITLILNFFILLYAMFFFLLRGPTLINSLIAYLPLPEDDSRSILERGLAVTRATLKSIFIIGLAQGLLVGIAFWIAGIPGAGFWGCVVVVLSAIPGIGPPLVWLPAAGYLMLADRLLAGILLALWGVVVVTLADHILRPHLVGKSASMPDLLILLSMFGGIAAFGPLGILLGPVLASILLTALNIYRKVFVDKVGAETSATT